MELYLEITINYAILQACILPQINTFMKGKKMSKNLKKKNHVGTEPALRCLCQTNRIS